MNHIKSIVIVNGAYEITVVCPECGKEYTIKDVDIQKYEAWKNGIIFAQDIGLSPSDAEMLITGTCPECWSKMFSED